jgi:hypothetical protein
MNKISLIFLAAPTLHDVISHTLIRTELFWLIWNKLDHEWMRGTSGQVLVFNRNDDHNRFVHRNWWCGITPLAERSQFTTHIPCILGWPKGCRRVMATVTTAFIPDVDIVISYAQVKSRPSNYLLSPVTGLKQASYGKKSFCSCGSTFSHNRPALAGYVVHDGFNWLSQHEFVEKELTYLCYNLCQSICIY